MIFLKGTLKVLKRESNEHNFEVSQILRIFIFMPKHFFSLNTAGKTNTQSNLLSCTVILKEFLFIANF